VLTLYHLTISHFSEKARWALDYKNLEYRSRVLTPGYHMLTARRVAGSRTLPVLLDDDTDTVLSESTDILHYLDRLRPDPPLFPLDADLATAVVEVEDLIDTGWGPNAAAFAYCHWVQSPGSLRRRWNDGLNVLQRGLLFAAMPLFTASMRRVRRLSLSTAPEYLAAAMRSFDDLEARLAANGGEYLVGDCFTAADLTGASLIGPFVEAPGSPWANGDRSQSPPEVQAFKDRLKARPLGQWALRMWGRHRR
jgi:glutathione S-transferase